MGNDQHEIPIIAGYSFKRFYKHAPYLLCLDGERVISKGPLGNEWNTLSADTNDEQLSKFVNTIRKHIFETRTHDYTAGEQDAAERLAKMFEHYGYERAAMDIRTEVKSWHKPPVCESIRALKGKEGVQ